MKLASRGGQLKLTPHFLPVSRHVAGLARVRESNSNLPEVWRLQRRFQITQQFMNDWVSKSLIVLFLAVLLMPFAQEFFDQNESCRRSGGDCAGGGCGNLLSLQETLDRDTIRFSQQPEIPHDETSR